MAARVKAGMLARSRRTTVPEITALAILGAYEVWATLVPEKANLVNFGANGQYRSVFTSGQTNSIAYLSANVPLPASVGLLLAGLGGLMGVARRRRVAQDPGHERRSDAEPGNPV
ncbi:VPLPA-CTERM sorting domain-containing protein [Meridianimarinicoccus sp. MJW13]|uniref:VPLPA-CTERM sorting domain-containing protein n=1 Tax=Meridianimarinicoccus sp. MJW13 TaxID=2720031 RepID=UPI0018677AD5|nr:VPLPA-CTERM sorting domain-containing protein [Fluviibacterium sp. MJW13]